MAFSQQNYSFFNNQMKELRQFCQALPEDAGLLIFIGGGTAALTYLYTHHIEEEFSHILILGDRGYWSKASHRLAQPPHILALPHTTSQEFANPTIVHPKDNLTPHTIPLHYVHSNDYQTNLHDLEMKTCAKLATQGKKVFIARNAQVRKIERQKTFQFMLAIEINQQLTPVMAKKIIITSGLGPARTLPFNLLGTDRHKIKKKVLSYTEVLTPLAEKCRDKNVLIYGGGATAAWAMEVTHLIARPKAWIAKSGFDEATNAGARVAAIINQTKPYQVHGKIAAVQYDATSEQLSVKVLTACGKVNYYQVDYLINCIGQDQYELGSEGLPEILAPKLQQELAPLKDKNCVTGDESITLGWTTSHGDLVVLGAAAGSYHPKNQAGSPNATISKDLPKSTQVPNTIGGVVSSICAYTNYQPFSQNQHTGEINLTSLNMNIMNATQLAVYLTALYPDARAAAINQAVRSFIRTRVDTEFGLNDEEIQTFLQHHLGHLPSTQIKAVPKASL